VSRGEEGEEERREERRRGSGKPLQRPFPKAFFVFSFSEKQEKKKEKKMVIGALWELGVGRQFLMCKSWKNSFVVTIDPFLHAEISLAVLFFPFPFKPTPL
jgi:hypothetical protein